MIPGHMYSYICIAPAQPSSSGIGDLLVWCPSCLKKDSGTNYVISQLDITCKQINQLQQHHLLRGSGYLVSG